MHKKTGIQRPQVKQAAEERDAQHEHLAQQVRPDQETPPGERPTEPIVRQPDPRCDHQDRT
jgi:hypothetical protein